MNCKWSHRPGQEEWDCGPQDYLTALVTRCPRQMAHTRMQRARNPASLKHLCHLRILCHLGHQRKIHELLPPQGRITPPRAFPPTEYLKISEYEWMEKLWRTLGGDDDEEIDETALRSIFYTPAAHWVLHKFFAQEPYRYEPCLTERDCSLYRILSRIPEVYCYSWGIAITPTGETYNYLLDDQIARPSVRLSGRVWGWARGISRAEEETEPFDLSRTASFLTSADDRP